jgi:hypothetical protein
MYGFIGKIRHLNDSVEEPYVFDCICSKGDFVYKIYSNEHPFQILFEEEEKEQISILMLLNTTNFLNPTLLSPTKTKYIMLNDIIIYPSSDPHTSSHIIFIKTTTMDKNSIKPSGILGMLLLAMMVQLNTGLAPRVSFVFVVPNDLFGVFTTPETRNLEKVSKPIGIFVVSVSDCSKNDIKKSFYLEATSTSIVSNFNNELVFSKKVTTSLSHPPIVVERLVKPEPQIKMFKLFAKWDEHVIYK